MITYSVQFHSKQDHTTSLLEDRFHEEPLPAVTGRDDLHKRDPTSTNNDPIKSHQPHEAITKVQGYQTHPQNEVILETI